MQKDENSTAEIKKKTGNKIRQVTYTTARKWWGLSSYWNRCMRWNLCDNFNWRIHGCSSREADKKSREEGVKVGCFSSFLFNAVRKGWLYDSGEHFLVFVLWCVQLSTVVIFIFFNFFLTEKENALNCFKLITKWFTACQSTKQIQLKQRCWIKCVRCIRLWEEDFRARV